jgi:GTPase involved in cell partitioning and DNA repair
LELQLFSPELAFKPQVVCYSKTDIPDAEILWEDVKQELIDRGVEENRVFPISAVSGKNTETAVRAIRKLLKEIPQELEPQTVALNLQEPLRDFENPKIEEFDISVQKYIGFVSCLS